MKSEIVIIHALLLMLVAGCSADPSQRLADADRALTTFATSVQAANDAGFIKDVSTKKALDTGLLLAVDFINRAHVAQAQASTQPSDSTLADTVRNYVDLFNAELPRLIQMLADAKKQSNG